MFAASGLLDLLLRSALPGSGPERAAQLATLCAPAPPGLAESPARFAPQEVTVGSVIDNDRATVMLRAMINAVKADRGIGDERARHILSRLDEVGAAPAQRQFVVDELARPMDLDGLVASVNSPRLAVQVYAASLFAIAAQTTAEAGYLRRLAERLGLEPAFIRELHLSFGVAPVT